MNPVHLFTKTNFKRNNYTTLVMIKNLLKKFQSESLLFYKGDTYTTIPLWNIFVWNAVIFEKIVSEDLQNRRSLFRLRKFEISSIWRCTKSLLKTEWFVTIFSWLGWRIELQLSQVCYFMYIFHHLLSICNYVVSSTNHVHVSYLEM